MKVEVWQDKVSVSVVTENDPNTKIWVGDDAKIIRTIEGIDWEDCMRQHHELMGWEEYKPFDKE